MLDKLRVGRNEIIFILIFAEIFIKKNFVLASLFNYQSRTTGIHDKLLVKFSATLSHY